MQCKKTTTNFVSFHAFYYGIVKTIGLGLIQPLACEPRVVLLTPAGNTEHFSKLHKQHVFHGKSDRQPPVDVADKYSGCLSTILKTLVASDLLMPFSIALTTR